MLDLSELVENQSVVTEARLRYSESEAYQSVLRSRYQRWHQWFAPNGDDQWPEDAARRPGKIHITANVIKPIIDVEARLQAKLPRIALQPSNPSLEERARAELVEKLMAGYLDASGWETWLHTLCKTKAIYGKGVLKAFWNKAERRPDVLVLENPANLRIGWGASDFSVMDWALYEYSLSPFEVMRRWPDVEVIPTRGTDPLQILQRAMGSHDDPLGQKLPLGQEPTRNYDPSAYEKKQVRIWDYWYKRGDQVYNCIILQKQVHAVPPTLHKEMVDIPYFVVENDHEPGSPEGMSSVGPLLDIQIEMNRELSHWAQLVADEIDPAWQADVDTLPPGSVPRSGEIIAVGEDGHITEIEKRINTFPIEQLHTAFWNQLHRQSGIPEIAFGNPGGSQVSGRALAVQIEGAINRLDPKRTLLYQQGIRDLLVFWTVMLERLNPKVDTGEGKVGIGQMVKGLRRWKIVAPEITPRDVMEHTTNTINKVNARLLSVHSAMDEIGIDSPEDELKLVGEERSTLNLFPGDVQVQLAVYAAMQQLQITAAQLAQLVNPNMANDRTGANNALAQQQQAQPGMGEGDNQGGQPATGLGGVPPADVNQTTLVRSTATQQPQALNQLSINRQLS